MWDEELCIQCGKCVLVCPHAVIRAKVYDQTLLANAPATFKTAKPKWREHGARSSTRCRWLRKTAPDARLCVEICPVKSKSEAKHKAINMEMQAPLARGCSEATGASSSRCLKSTAAGCRIRQVKDIQLLEPLFEFSGACAGCGETPYLKLLTQLFGDRLLIANATGCSSIYGGNLPTTPYYRQ